MYVSTVTLEQTNCKHTRTNWHEAASYALQIELRDYSDILEYGVISYNKKNLEREIQNESRQHDRQQRRVKRYVKSQRFIRGDDEIGNLMHDFKSDEYVLDK